MGPRPPLLFESKLYELLISSAFWQAREEVEGLQEQARSEQASRMTASHTLLQEAYRAIGTSGGRELPRPPRAARREMQVSFYGGDPALSRCGPAFLGDSAAIVIS